MKSFSELSKIPSFRGRFEYLKIGGEVGFATFGFDRYLNRKFYSSVEWKSIRNFVIVRDKGLDLGVEGHDISGPIYVHHMNPISVESFKCSDPGILDPEYLICVSLNTHNAIHYGDDSFLDYEDFAVRYKGDTTLWKKE
jgi:hypothetical protein